MKKVLVIALILLLVISVSAREKIRVPVFADDTLRITWKVPAEKPLYFKLYQRSYANPEAPIPMNGGIPYSRTSLKKQILVQKYTERLTFFVVAVYKTRTLVVSDTLASFYGNPPHVFCDVNGDKVVNDDDFNIVHTSVHWGAVRGNTGYDAYADVNGDGFIDLVDLGFVETQICRKKNKESYSKYDMYWQLP
ncbi:MAG TPA: dockerin type I domain-containing protein [Bacteroidales bacterium]|mgnify:CR=1 FL=1|nr:dockerin type I domain-containing protein [Bacteroidales bacterium]